MPDHPTSGFQPVGADRRRWKRIPAEALPDVKAAFTSGQPIEWLDISRGGVQFRSDERLLPGSHVTLHFVTPDGDITVRGEIVRSVLVQLPTGDTAYEVGLSFEEALSGPLAEATARAEALADTGRRASDKAAHDLSVEASIPHSVEELVEIIGPATGSGGAQ